MSAILKALKKLEQETASSAGAPMSGSAGKPHRPQKKKWIVPGLIVFFLCVLIGGGAAMFVRKSSVDQLSTVGSTDMPPVTVAQKQKQGADPHPAAAAAARKQEQTRTAEPAFEFATTIPIAAEHRRAAAQNDIAEHIPVPPDAVPADAPSATITPDAPEENLPPVEETVEETVEAPAPQPETRIIEAPIPSIPDKPVAENPAVRKSDLSVPILDDPSLQLQAISWSEDADKRMAIINGKICRERDRVDGYVIDAINSGDVILSKGSASGKLVFKIR